MSVETSKVSFGKAGLFNKKIYNELGSFTGLLIIGFVFSITTDNFFTVNNLLTVALQTAYICLLAIAETYVIITSGIDLSVGSILAVSGVVCGKLLLAGFGIPLSMLAAILVGGLCGAINGLAISRMGIAPFIATLGMMSIGRGVANVITDSLPVSGLPEDFFFIGGGTVLGIIPVPVIIMLLVAMLFAFILNRTAFGKYVFALGSNEDAARLSGVNIGMTTIGVYAVSGLLSGLVGVMLAARLVSAQAQAGLGYELDAIAASIIGGVSPMGGSGTILGTIIGAFIMGVLRNGLNLLNVNAFWQQIAIGVVIIVAVYIDKLRRK
ncbi:ABC transporter permease [Pelosinus baikalensis]|uniref:ABC transporter permease n=1 Tax=Pelosinus baikalensis TaxID=2892015 RepID=A0ABS8HNB2_9FIRM|nr:ABC transporter permease [Pelosinus baikalensis]MCC5464629.1 ABC transporter permease [Pelosinus baikalensis]